MTIQEIFDALRNGSEADKEAAKAFVRHPENRYRLCTSSEFVQAAKDNVDLFTIVGDEYDIDIDEETECPHCGQPLNW